MNQADIRRAGFSLLDLIDGKSVAAPIPVSRTLWANSGGQMDEWNKDLIEKLRLLQRSAWNQILEAETPLIRRIYEQSKNLADALEELNKRNHPDD